MNSDSFVSLMYHNIVPEHVAAADERWLRRLSPSITKYFVTAESFARQMQMLAESADFLGSTGIEAFFANRKVEPFTTRPRVAITFDDGWQGCVEHAGPILAKYGWKAVVFVTTELIDRPGFLTREQLQELSPDVFETGSHAVTHGFLNEQSTASIRRELQDSRAVLEDLLGRRVDMVSIPNGAVDHRVREMAVDVGYRFLFTSDAHLNTHRTGPLRIGRLPVRRCTNPQQVLEFSQGRLGQLQWRRTLLRIPRRLLGPRGYRRIRRTLLGDRGDQLEMHDLASASADSVPAQRDHKD